LAILVTSGTVASAVLMARRLPSGVIHQYVPLDAPKAAARFLDHWRPDLIVFVESEIWPGLLLQAKGRGARLALLSARMSQSSLKGWARARGAARVVFGAFDLVMAQDNETAQGLTALGARDDGRLNLKLAGAPLATDPVRLAALQTAAAGRPVLLAASTHPGEDEIVRDAFAALAPGALLVIVPRHPVRGPAVAALFEGAGLASRGDPFGASAVYVADTLGELGLWFALARTALVGGSLLPGPGGHNPVEPAHLGCLILTGPHIDNWRGIYAALTQADAVSVVKDAPTLALAFAEALSSPATARAERARAIVAGGEKGLDAAVGALLKLTP
jgi:3-deoxy-D-manno-octulosonic-acid transferase